jgi:hypothetical protein
LSEVALFDCQVGLFELVAGIALGPLDRLFVVVVGIDLAQAVEEFDDEERQKSRRDEAGEKPAKRNLGHRGSPLYA